MMDSRLRGNDIRKSGNDIKSGNKLVVSEENKIRNTKDGFPPSRE
jgi:hypothetical protein